MKRFMNAAALVAVALGMVFASVAPAADAVIVGCTVDSCHQDCGKLVCKPICTTKTVTKRTYTDRCTPVCLPGLFGCLSDKCSCSCVKYQKDLVVKIRKTEECVKKCVPVHEAGCTTCAPACTTCAPACSTAPAIMDAPVGQPAVIVIPTMPAGPMVMPSPK